MSTQYRLDGDIAIIEITNPPVNGLGLATRTGIVADLERALADAEVRAIVLTGSAKAFSAGADITEFGTPAALASPRLTEVIAAVEDSPKSVVAAIAGSCLGGGLELALGAHYRVADAAARIGLPEVALGLVPGATGTQRLPRVLDARTAADMITGGAPRTARALSQAPGQKILDLVVDGDVIAAAVEYARGCGGATPKVRELTPDPAAAADVASLRGPLTKRSRGFLAPLLALDLVEKALTLPYEEGVAAEREVFLELVGGPQSAARRHAFFAERAAQRIPGLAATPREIGSVAVVGAGTMGGGIAMAFLDAGVPVTLLETAQEPLDRGLATIRRNYRSQVDKGRLSAAALEARLALLTPTTDYADLGGVDLAIEAVFEDMGVKEAVFGSLDKALRPGAILASNTSTLDLDAIAGFTKRPESVVGLHFFSPANVMPLLEVVRGAATSDEVLATAMALAKRIGKVGVVSGVCDGFIGNRMLAKYRGAASELLEAGATPAEIDAAIEGFGFAMGPYRMGDMAGNDIGHAIRQRRYAEHPDAPREVIADRLCELGRYGQKTGAGWYDYAPGKRDALPSPVVDELLAEYHRERGTVRREFAAAEIVARLVYALADEGARILAEGIALRASDIDVVYLAGYGFPRHHGGPMFYADTVGLPVVAQALRDVGIEPAPLLASLAAEGKTFN
ncbi:3-hydroxyacyl-CoA dehydrogenase NAD-binding domain-containing protein [Tomitella biformata]|uniref:3-hydroxyacyl-CoA dehydrogenase NAD-binding domain-containing protein n=1 Tax=Tomitella biformata TaxID=630403 RepID=UPI00046570FD|nr:3-hydroxyacyl-CoA dehydrogenase NAD-binding domain-containing protein [Tomitella biformata]